jgi:tripeptidyl-peptidase-1
VQWLQAPSISYNGGDINSQSAVVVADLSADEIEEVCNASMITPDCLSTLYGTKGYTPKVPTKSKIGYCNYLEETTISTDLAKFLDTYRPQAKDAKVDIRLVNNGENQQVLDSAKLNASADVEGNLDGQTIMGMVWPIPVVAYNTGGRPMVTTPYTPLAGKAITNEPYLDWLDYMQGLSDSEIPPTISTSYGEDEQSVPPDYARRVCQSFAQLGSRGVTLLFSSGHAGVGSRSPTSDRCEIYPDPEVAANAVPNFMPAFPASCPYVTTVGATKGLGLGNFSMEVAAGYPANVSTYASGGGFSNYFSRPAWQDSVVRDYMNGLTPDEVDPNMYNHSGRAYPDVAANGQHYSVVWDLQFIMVDGTSASAPTMASVIALLNDDLIANGRPPLGFMNPWLYSTGKAGFTDIISGSAKGCGVDGFPAKTGWDAVTGFGTPVSLDDL